MANSFSQLDLDIIPVSKWNDYFEYPTVGAMRQYIWRNTKNFKNTVVRFINGKQFIKISAFKQWVEDINK